MSLMGSINPICQSSVISEIWIDRQTDGWREVLGR